MTIDTDGRPDVRQLPTHTDAAKWNDCSARRMETTWTTVSSTWQGQSRQQNNEDLMPYYHEFLRLAETGGVGCRDGICVGELR
ncbi:MAG: hypothetical protein ACFHHU_01625 [Porticoccaceae bacterium]